MSDITIFYLFLSMPALFGLMVVLGVILGSQKTAERI